MKHEEFNFIVKPELLVNISFVKSVALRIPHRQKHCWINHFISCVSMQVAFFNVKMICVGIIQRGQLWCGLFCLWHQIESPDWLLTGPTFRYRSQVSLFLRTARNL